MPAWLLGLTVLGGIASLVTIGWASVIFIRWLSRRGKGRSDGGVTSIVKAEPKQGNAEVEVFFARRFPMWWDQQKWYRIGVRNTSATAADKVEVILRDIVPDPLPVNPLPSKLGRKGGGTDNCCINPTSEDYFDVLRRIPNEERCLQLWTVEWSGQKFELDPNTEYKMSVWVTAANAEKKAAQFGLRHPLGGELEFYPISNVSP